MVFTIEDKVIIKFRQENERVNSEWSVKFALHNVSDSIANTWLVAGAQV